MILLDTDHLSVLADARHSLHSQLVDKLKGVNEPVAVPIIAVEEQLRAWLAQIRRVASVHHQVVPYERLALLIGVLSDWEIVKWNNRASDEFTRHRKARIRIGTQDLKIAALTVVHGARLLSANLRDFNQVPGLHVEDWLFSGHTRA
jgi:tRNA(fMet)-specific endonuclease VapC